jgi:hypothetical protein
MAAMVEARRVHKSYGDNEVLKTWSRWTAARSA